MEQIYIEIYLKWIYYIWNNMHFTLSVSLLILLHGFLFKWLQQWRLTIIMRMVLMNEVFILQWSGEMKSTNVVVVCLLIWFLCSSWCGVAAATLLAKDEPIKRSFQTEQMCISWLNDLTCNWSYHKSDTILIWYTWWGHLLCCLDIEYESNIGSADYSHYF